MSSSELSTGDDPYKWSVTEACNAVSKWAQSSNLPEESAHELREALIHHQVSGATLLSEVTEESLKHYLGISSSDVRTQLLRHIKQLQTQSTGFRAQTFSSKSNTRWMSEEDAASLSPTSGARLKSRAAALPASPRKVGLNKFSATPVTGHNSPRLDAIFHGPSSIGRPLNDGGNLNHANEFGFALGPDKANTKHSDPAHGLLQHAFVSPERINFDRDGSRCVASVPYKEGLVPLGNPHCSTVVHEDGLVTVEDTFAIRAELESTTETDTGGGSGLGSVEGLSAKARYHRRRKEAAAKCPIKVHPKLAKKAKEEEIRRVQALQKALDNQDPIDFAQWSPSLRALSKFTHLVKKVQSTLDDKDLDAMKVFVNPVKRGLLRKAAVKIILRSVLKVHELDWDFNSKPAYRDQGGNIWNFARDPDTRHELLVGYGNEIRNLENRLMSQVDKIEENEWSNVKQIAQQSESLNLTIAKLQLQKWFVSVIHMKQHPATRLASHTHKISTCKFRWQDFALKMQESESRSITPNSEQSMDVDDMDYNIAGLMDIDPSGLSSVHPPSAPNDQLSNDVNTSATREHSGLDIPHDKDLVHSEAKDIITSSVVMAKRLADSTTTPTAQCEIIDLTENDGEFKEPRPMGLLTVAENPKHADREEKEGWDTAILIAKKDDLRLLIKTLHAQSDGEDDVLYGLAMSILKSRKLLANVVDDCQRVLNLLQNGRTERNDKFTIARKLIRLRMVHFYCNPIHFFDDDRKEKYNKFFNDLGPARRSIGSWKDFNTLVLDDLALALEPPSDAFRAAQSLDNPLPTLQPQVTVGRNVLPPDCTMEFREKIQMIADRYRQHQTTPSLDPKYLETRRTEFGVVTSKDILVVNPTAAPEDFIVIPDSANRDYEHASLKSHQVSGIRFLYREIVMAKEKEGCVLAHTMGLGKSRQILSFLDTVAHAASSSNLRNVDQIPLHLRKSRTLIICPAALTDNWRDQIRTWLSDESLTRLGGMHRLDDKVTSQRVGVLEDWAKKGGIVIISYTLLGTLFVRAQIHDHKVKATLAKAPKTKRTTKAEKSPEEMAQLHQILKLLLNDATLVIADEAQAIKNASANATQAVARFKTKSRIAMTGTPLSNNIEEYFTMLNWVAQGHLGDLADFRKEYKNPIEAGLYVDSSEPGYLKARKLLYRLIKRIDPKVDRKGVSVLKGEIPSKTEFIITVPLSQLQQDAYNMYVEKLTANKEELSIRIFGWLALLSTLVLHPQLFSNKLHEQHEKNTEPVAGLKTDVHGALPDVGDLDQPLSKYAISNQKIEMLKRFFQDAAVSNDDLRSTGWSYKCALILNIIEYCRDVGDKVLIFSQYKKTFDFVEHLMKKDGIPCSRLDGDVKPFDRQSNTHKFNVEDQWSVYLVSTHAGGVGLHMTGANRVITLDHTFNPANEDQAVGRAYRLGQPKPVFVYRIITGGSFEQELHNTAVFKQQLATRVVDKKAVQAKAMKVASYIFPVRTSGKGEVDPCRDLDEVLDRVLLEHPASVLSVRTTDYYCEPAVESFSASDEVVLEYTNSRDTLARAGPTTIWRLRGVPEDTLSPSVDRTARPRRQRESEVATPPRQMTTGRGATKALEMVTLEE